VARVFQSVVVVEVWRGEGFVRREGEVEGAKYGEPP
jgi:hypothetical protein